MCVFVSVRVSVCVCVCRHTFVNANLCIDLEFKCSSSYNYVPF